MEGKTRSPLGGGACPAPHVGGVEGKALHKKINPTLAAPGGHAGAAKTNSQTMIIGLCTLQLSIPMALSLKEKRQVVKSLIARVRNEFNVSIAEVDDQDLWQSAVLAIACVSTAQSHAHSQLEAVVRFIDRQRPDCPIGAYEIEML